MPERAPASDRKAPASELLAASDAASSAPDASPAAPPTEAAAPADAGAPLAETRSDQLSYDPLKPGDQILAEVALSVSANLQGGPPGRRADSKLSLDCKLLVELKVKQLSQQRLDLLELTVSTLSMHMDLGGHSSDSKHEPPKTYEVSLSGQSPNIRARDGSTLDAAQRATLTLLVAPIAEFHSHWLRSPTLALKPGWSNKVPISVPAFAANGNDTVHVGPFEARYKGRDANSDNVPFEVALPIQYSTELGKLSFDLSGTAQLNAAKGRPTSLDLSGPLSARGGPSATGAQMSFTGTTKFGATLSYH